MDSRKIFSYTVFFEPVEEGGFSVSVPYLPGCVSQGETFEEAKKNIEDAIKGYIAVLKEDGDSIPEEPRESIVATVVAHFPA